MDTNGCNCSDQETAPRIDASAKIGKNFNVGEFAVVEANVVIEDDVGLDVYGHVHEGAFIGRGARIGAGSDIGKNARIGAGTDFYDDASIGEGAIIGENVKSRYCLIVGKSSVIGNGCEFANHVTVGDNVAIEDNVKAGDDVTIADGARIARGTVIGDFQKIPGADGRTLDSPWRVTHEEPECRTFMGKTPQGDNCVTTIYLKKDSTEEKKAEQ